MGKVKKCAECSTYTLEDRCPRCDAETSDPEPPAFSMPDRYGDYRRETKRRMQAEEHSDA